MHFRLCPIHAQTRPRTKTVAFQEALVRCHPGELCWKIERPAEAWVRLTCTSTLETTIPEMPYSRCRLEGGAVSCVIGAPKLSRSDDVRPRAPGTVSQSTPVYSRRWARWAGAAMAAVFDLTWRQRKAAKARASQSSAPR